jgi:hypothetical protein
MLAERRLVKINGDLVGSIATSGLSRGGSGGFWKPCRMLNSQGRHACMQKGCGEMFEVGDSVAWLISVPTNYQQGSHAGGNFGSYGHNVDLRMINEQASPLLRLDMLVERPWRYTSRCDGLMLGSSNAPPFPQEASLKH